MLKHRWPAPNTVTKRILCRHTVQKLLLHYKRAASDTPTPYVHRMYTYWSPSVHLLYTCSPSVPLLYIDVLLKEKKKHHQNFLCNSFVHFCWFNRHWSNDYEPLCMSKLRKRKHCVGSIFLSLLDKLNNLTSSLACISVEKGFCTEQTNW